MQGPVIGVMESVEEGAGPYMGCVEAAGGTALVVDLSREVDVEGVLSRVAGMVFTGGADVDPALYGQSAQAGAGVRSRPERDRRELPLLRAALARELPVLGICRGMQLLNVALGGSLVQDVPGHRAAKGEKMLTHKVFVPPGAKLTNIYNLGGILTVNSMHHQGVTLAQKAPGMLVGAYSLVGDGFVEAIERPGYERGWVVGVQWHPELRAEGSASTLQQKLFEALVAEARGAGVEA
ncbi:MAG: gamma-glutamyl-gamma-aminobutyrate hydrolase family protein [Dehalococcoidia bacterium]|nr:gamma-glutamyl-gamma-aminobutyrate hydrolase family protein [Dehalococcoidia bacterium]